MKNIDLILEKMAGELSSLNYDFLTEKELNRAHRFLQDLSTRSKSMKNNQMFLDRPEWAEKHCSDIINGLRSYLDSLKLKIKKRETIPNWYIQNKL